MPVGEGDTAALHALWTDPVVRRFLWDDVVIPRDRAREEVARGVAQAPRGLGDWLVHRSADGELVGWVALREMEGDDVELYWALHPRHHGRGFATEAAAVLLEHAFGSLGLARVLAGTDPPNAASLRVMERLGMTFLEERRPGGRVAVYHVSTRRTYEARDGGTRRC